MHGLTDLLHGTGIIYFTYWPTDAFEGQGMVLSAGDGRGKHEYRVGPHYYEAQRINSVLKIFGGRLLHAQSTGELLSPQPLSSGRIPATRSGTPTYCLPMLLQNSDLALISRAVLLSRSYGPSVFNPLREPAGRT